jgi:hypothetical protein
VIRDLFCVKAQWSYDELCQQWKSRMPGTSYPIEVKDFNDLLSDVAECMETGMWQSKQVPKDMEF